MRGLYVLESRNLTIGVFNGHDGFIGIRTKMGDRFLSTEYHWDTGAPHGTAKPVERIGTLPDEIELREYEPLSCSLCGGGAILADPPDKGWKHDDPDNECSQLSLSLEVYRPLFLWLEPYEGAPRNYGP